MKKRLEFIGQVELLDSDPKNRNAYSNWHHFCEHVILQREWDHKAT